MTLDLVIFDCDGVLVDSEIITCRVYARELGRLGFRITVEEVAARFIGARTSNMCATLEAEQGIAVPEGFVEHLLQSVLDSFDTELKAMPHVRAALEAISLPVCVVSGSDLSRVETCLRLTGLFDVFAPRIFSAQMVARTKPFPDLFLFAAQSLEKAPESCLVIEDSVTGVEAGRAAAMAVFGFTGASHCQPGLDHRLRSAGASLVFRDMAELPKLIDEAMVRRAD